MAEEDLDGAREVASRLVQSLGGETSEVKTGLSRVSLVGSGMTSLPGVYARAFEALVAEAIEVYALSSSAITITMMVDTEAEERTLQALHSAFSLGEGGT